ncbi:MAG: DUF2931 family protein [Bacteroidales bacterium]|jgi:hypothetical protein|nr:DUF2931 family protein [Bacteroidales bacterium]
MNTLNTNKYRWSAAGNAPLLFPTELVMGDFLFDDDTKLKIIGTDPFASTWGKPISISLSPEKYLPAPKYILMAWFSLVEGRFYGIIDALPKEVIERFLSEKNEITQAPKYNTLIAGMAPYGKLAIWLSGNNITTQVAWLHGKEVLVNSKELNHNAKLTKEEYAKQALAKCKEACENFRKNGLPHPSLFEQYMQKFNYRITPTFENAKFERIEINYYNGECNALNSGEHTLNTMRAKPSKITLHWSKGKERYEGNFCTNEQKIVEAFSNFYGNDVEKEGELIIQIDSSQKKCRILLQSKDASVEIPVEEMKYVVFNKNENP